jgi:peptidyl-prolyl cis-trans isomerase C
MRVRRYVQLGVALFLLAGFSLIFAAHLHSEEEKVLAKVGEMVITDRDLEEVMARSIASGRKKVFTVEDKKRLLDSYVNTLLMAQEARREKMDEKPEIKMGMKTFHDDLIAQEYLKKHVLPFANVTDQEIEAKMKGNPNLVPRELLLLREIVVPSEQEALEIHEELKKGKDFSETAKAKSISSTKNRGGQMPQVTRGQLPPVLEEAAFSLNIGEFSKPLKTDAGYCILFLANKKVRTPEEIKRYLDLIKDKLKQIEMKQKIAELVAKKVDEVRKDYKTEIYFDRIE